ncbi:hypothetical protein ALC53_05360 [Atta colombica]|uniref:Uncharacterized protein n=1 Tax=Atta colombica TaxID=520822 RepID=A0A195BHH2_9HYME|nr:hypothetical protein ALC53_05360 [Atta colombica]
MDFHHLIIIRFLKEKFIGAFGLHISHARHKLMVSLLPGDFRKRGTWSRRPTRRRLKLLAAEDVAYPRSRRSPVSRTKRVYALMPSLFLGVVIVVVVVVVLVVVVVFVVGDSEEAETAVGSWRNARVENIKGPKEAAFQASRKPDERICFFFFHFFFRNSGASPKREKSEELLELMTKAIQNTGLLWPLRTRSQPRFYFREIRHFKTLHEHPKQFDDTFVSIYKNTLYGTSRERIGNACRRTTSRSDSFSFGNEIGEKYEEKRSSKEKRN